MEKVLVMTGGSRGIGYATIKKFMKEGWAAINLSRTPCELGEVTNIQIDLNDDQSISSIQSELEKILAGGKKIALVHNAAYYKQDAIATLTLTDFLKTLKINLIAPMILNQMMIPMMKATSSIIYIGSTLAEKAVPGSASYIVSKHAVVGLMKATCQDLSGYQIHTSCICPGLVDTKMLKDTIPAEVIKFLQENKIIGGRLIQAEEIADVIFYSAMHPVINGTSIHANLGQVGE